MKKYRKNLILALVCFLIVIVLNFFLPRLLPGNPIAYLTGFSEEDMTPAQAAYYRQALHLDKPVFVQFGYYLRSLADGTLGYSYKKEATVSTLIGQRLGYTLQITLPAVLLSTVIGLLWGLRCGYKKGSGFEKFSPTYLNIIPYNPICRQEKIFTNEQNLPLIIIAIQPVYILPVPLSIIPRTAVDGIIFAGNTTHPAIRTIHHSIISFRYSTRHYTILF